MVKKQQEGGSLGLTIARAARSLCAVSTTLSLAGSRGNCSKGTPSYTNNQVDSVMECAHVMLL